MTKIAVLFQFLSYLHRKDKKICMPLQKLKQK